MPFLGGLIGGGLGLIGSLFGASASANNAQTQANAIAAASQGAQFAPWQAYGPLGMQAGPGQANPQGGTGGFTGFGSLAGVGGNGAAYNPYGSSPSYGSPSAYSPDIPYGAFSGGAVTPGQATATQGMGPGGPAYNPGTAYGNQNYMAPTATPYSGQTDATGQGIPAGTPFNATGLANQNFNVNVGALAPTMGGLNALAQQQTGMAGLMGSQLPSNVMAALGQANGALNTLPQGTQGQLGGLYGGNQFGQNMATSLMGAGFNQLQNPLIGAANAGAIGQIQGANSNYNSAYNTSLNSAMQALQPGILQGSNALLNSQFEKGQAGTSGGALQSQAFNTSMNQAILQAQNQAVNQGLSAQQTAFQGANTFSNIGASQTGTGNQLLSNAFGNYNNQSTIGQNIANSIFNQNAQINQAGVNYGQQNFANQIQAAGLPAQLASGYLGNANTAISGISGINQQGLNYAQLALNGMLGQSNAANKAASNLGSIATSPNLIGGGAAGMSTLFNSIGSGITGTSNPFSALGNSVTGAINNSNYTYNPASTGGGVNPGYTDPNAMGDVFGGGD